MNHPVEARLSCPYAIVVPAGGDMRREEPCAPRVSGTSRAGSVRAGVIESTKVSQRVTPHETALQQKLSRYQTMFERGSLGQVTLQFPSLRIDAVNRAFCTMTGYGNKDLVGHGPATIKGVGIHSFSLCKT